MRKRKLDELTTADEVRRAGMDLQMKVVKGVALGEFNSAYWGSVKIENTFFLGCSFDSIASTQILVDRGAVIVPTFGKLPYKLFRKDLYTSEELLEPAESGLSTDHEIYCDYLKKDKFSPDVIEALCRRIHDSSVDDALSRLIKKKESENIVGFMGGSSNKRCDVFYKKTAELARLLTLENKFVVSGGGPGMMEAANLGAYFARYSEADLAEAIEILGTVPDSKDQKAWLKTAQEVKNKFRNGQDSLGIPTWFYGFEPTNIFATHIAKYFDNSVREGGLVQVGKGGIVFAPGSAGTRQEIFMDAAQNHYGTTGFFSPMIFLGKCQYKADAHVFQLLQEVATPDYKDLLFITDEPKEALEFLRKHRPNKAISKPDPVCDCLP